MLHLTRQYIAEQAGNTLAPYLCGLEACAERGETVDDAEYGVYGGGASDIAAQRLGQPFLAAWADAANRDPVFRKVQRDLRDSMYWAPALAATAADGVGLLGLALYYDTSVNHGPGVAESGDGSFDDIGSRTIGPTPARGGSESAWLRAWLSCRAAVLSEWGDNPPDGRIALLGASRHREPDLDDPVHLVGVRRHVHHERPTQPTARLGCSVCSAEPTRRPSLQYTIRVLSACLSGARTRPWRLTSGFRLRVRTG